MTPLTAKRVGEAIEIDGGDSVTLRLNPDQARQLADSIHDAIEDVHHTADPRSTTPRPTDDAPKDGEPDSQLLYRSESVGGGQWVAEPGPPRISEAMRTRVRPHAATVRFSVGVMRFMEHAGVDPASVAEVIAEPDHRWNTPNPRAQDLSEAAVRDDAPYGAVYYRNTDGVAYVISVRRSADLYADRRSITVGNRSASQGTRRSWPAIDDLDSLKRFAESVGLRFSLGERHGRVYDPRNPQRGHVTVPLTPSDNRSWLNCLSQIRRTFELRG